MFIFLSKNRRKKYCKINGKDTRGVIDLDSTFLIVIAVCIIAVVLIIGANLVTIKLGYSIKHTIDPMPDQEWHEESKDK